MVNSQDKKNNGQKSNKPPRDWLSIIIAISAVVISGIAAYFSFEQIDIAKDTAKKQLRAYVDIKPNGWHGLIEAGIPLTFDYRFINSGQTPASNVRIRGQIEILDFPPSPNFAPQYLTIKTPEQIATIFPTDTNLTGGIPAIQNITQEDMLKSTNNGRAVFLFYQISYADCFSSIHSTWHCQYVDPRSIEIKNDTIQTWKWINYSKFIGYD